MGQLAIKVEGLWKEYVVGHVQERHSTFYDLLAKNLTAPLKRLRNLRGQTEETDRFWALRDVNFEIQPGEVVGVVGRNGAGKSTLLKILSRITAPTRGKIEMRGRLASLLEVGTGFHFELSGRENIYLNGAILGMTRKEVARKFDEIVAFAEIGKFLDTPVKRYSSGMYVRLAFAVAAHLEPDILVIDEVLAVGDASFQKRCLGKIKDVAGQGRTILFVSHNLAAVSRLCGRVLWLRGGAIELDGSCQPVLQQYEDSDSGVSPRTNRDFRQSAKAIYLSGLKVFAFDKTETEYLYPGSGCIFEIRGHVKADSKRISVQVGLYDAERRRLCLIDSTTADSEFELSKGDFVLDCQIETVPLVSGRYTLNVAIKEGKNLIDAIERCAVLNVSDANGGVPGLLPAYGPLLLRHQWRIAAEATDL